jgi:hypothetical protein
MEAAMSEGLIGDRLHIFYPAGVEMVAETHPDGEWYSRPDVLALLRSDETVEAVARVLHREDYTFEIITVGYDEMPSSYRAGYRRQAQLVLRLLAGSDE